MCGYGDEESNTAFIENGVIKTVASGMLHSRVIRATFIL